MIRILTTTAGPAPGPVVKVERWYDRPSRAWVVARKDANGFQIGDALWTADKPEAIATEREWRAELANAPTNGH